ncbi:carbamoyltransferase HypF [Methyloterricola oryzae]|uniref:carbamoyltransferase HypF n=1 Tax=Methyloterricola oryzae TaxID=1495050 RepID=UPI0005EB9DDF|nr:carbamoyltransferase HypF [Methyloterricola oryzae]
MTTPTLEGTTGNGVSAKSLTVTGRVQGVGFRPFVNRLALRLQLNGWVRNSVGQVEILVQGSPDAIKAFEHLLVAEAPPLARPERVSSQTVSPEPLGGFVILHSEARGEARNHIPPDYFLCDDCLAEMQDPAQRRYRYPFINCTQCGPRYTIIDRLPYDRPHTSMAGFPLCSDCRREYEDPADRRYHAQPLACPVCGPKLLFRGGGSAITDTEMALAACVDALRRGLIVAAKGVGGYHLLCDASQEAAVARLRDRKHRPHKPFAVMLPWHGDDGLAWVMKLADPAPEQLALLRDPLRPIVLVPAREDSTLAPSVAPGMAEIGLMLPYSPLHHLILGDFRGPLVATSANLSGEPVLTDPDEAEQRLGNIADAFLHHDRPIRRPADDAVFRSIAGAPRPLRLGRGCAPLELALPVSSPQPLLALGGQMKNTVTLAWGERAVISPHVGELGSRRSQAVFEQLTRELADLYGVKPEIIACDAHPDYANTRWAQATGLPVVRVYHHHAHASALAGELGAIENPMLVFTWDGTGYGEDGSIWGGEALWGRPGDWTRVASWRPFRLPGGDQASRQPWRSALALLWEVGFDTPLERPEAALLRQAWERGLNCPVSSSVGRIFDAAAAMTGLMQECSFEGQAAMCLEAISDYGAPPIPLALELGHAGLLHSDFAPLLSMLCDTSLSVAERGGIFHASLARAMLDQAVVLREAKGFSRVGLCGGVFQNRLLTEMAIRYLSAEEFEVAIPKRVPANDAGLSFGQAVEAMARLAGNERR